MKKIRKKIKKRKIKNIKGIKKRRKTSGNVRKWGGAEVRKREEKEGTKKKEKWGEKSAKKKMERIIRRGGINKMNRTRRIGSWIKEQQCIMIKRIKRTKKMTVAE